MDFAKIKALKGIKKH